MSLQSTIDSLWLYAWKYVSIGAYSTRFNAMKRWAHQVLMLDQCSLGAHFYFSKPLVPTLLPLDPLFC